MSKKTDKNSIENKFNPKRVSSAGPENDLLLDYDTERVVAGKGGMENTVGYMLPADRSADIRYGKKVDPTRKEHRYHGVGAGILVCILLLIVALACVACGGTVWAWDRYAYPYVNLTLPETVSLVSEMYKVDPDEIVTNPYDPVADLDSFYASFKKGMYLSEDCELTIDQILNAVLPQQGEGEQPGENASTEGTGSAAFDALLETLEFDFSTLDGKQNPDLEKEVLEISDKELAAVLNEAMKSVFAMEEPFGQYSEQYGVNFENLVRVEQVVVEGVESVTEQSDARVLVTVSLDLENNITAIAEAVYNNLARKSIEESKPDLVGTLDGVANAVIPKLKDMLPKSLYFTVAVYPNSDSDEAYITYNNLSEEKQALLEKVFDGSYLKMAADVNSNGVMDYGEESLSIPEIVNGVVYNTIRSLGDTVTLNFVNTADDEGAVQTKPIELMLTMLGATNITQAQFLAIMRDIEVPYEDMLAAYPEEEGAECSQSTLELNLDNFINDTENGFAAKYYFNNVGADGNPVITAQTIFDDIQNIMSDEMIAQIMIADPANWNFGQDYVYDADEFKPQADYNAIPQLINGYLARETEGGLGGMPAKVLKAEYTDNGTAEGAITLTIKAEIKQMVEDQLASGGNTSQAMNSLIEQLLPPAIYLKVTYALDGSTSVEISINDADEDYGAGQSEQDFETVFELLTLFGVQLSMGEGEDVVTIEDYSQMCDMVGDTVASAFTEVGVRLGGDLVFTEDKVLFPNIFQVISANEILSYSYDPTLPEQGVDQDEFDELYAVDDAELFEILNALYGYESPQTAIDDNIDNIKAQLTDKYYVDLVSEDATALYDEIKTLDGNLSKIRMKNDTGATSSDSLYMADDTRALDQLRPVFDAHDIAVLVQASGQLNMADISVMKDTRIMESTIGSDGNGDYIQLTITAHEIDAGNVSPDAAKYAPLFPEKMTVIVTIRETADGTTSFDTVYNINGIQDELMTKTMFFVSRLSGDTELSKEAVDQSVQDGVNNAFDSLTVGGAVDLDIDGAGQSVSFGTIFSVATATIWSEGEGENKVVLESRPTDADFRATIQGLWSGLDGYGYANGSDIAALGYTESIAPFYVDDVTFDGQQVTVSANTRISDAFIGSQLAATENIGNIALSLGVDPTEIGVYQTYILPATADSADTDEAAKFNGIVGYFAQDGGNLLVDLSDDYGDMIFTLEVGKQAFGGQVANPDLETLIPDSIFVSAGITVSESGLSDENVRIAFNRLSEDQIAILREMMGLLGYEVEGLFGGVAGQESFAEKIANTVIVELSNAQITQLGSNTFPITVRDLFSYASGENTRFASAIIEDLGDFGTDAQPKYLDNYIYWDYSGDYSNADATKFEDNTLPAEGIEKVGLGYLTYILNETVTIG